MQRLIAPYVPSVKYPSTGPGLLYTEHFSKLSDAIKDCMPDGAEVYGNIIAS
jgi:hypothetical protein